MPNVVVVGAQWGDEGKGKVIDVALVGNPNCGKTTLFNSLTGSHQHVGNYAGVTVEKRTGVCRSGDLTLELVDDFN